MDWKSSIFPTRWVNVCCRSSETKCPEDEEEGTPPVISGNWTEAARGVGNSPLMALTTSRQQSCKYQVNRSRLEQSGQTWGLIAGGVEAPVLRRIQVSDFNPLVDDPCGPYECAAVSQSVEEETGQLLLILASYYRLQLSHSILRP